MLLRGVCLCVCFPTVACRNDMSVSCGPAAPLTRAADRGGGRKFPVPQEVVSLGALKDCYEGQI